MLALLLSAALAAGAHPASPAGAAHRAASARAIAHYLEARRAEADGDLPRALSEMEQALVFDGASAQIRLARAGLLAQMARLTEAEDEARRAVALDPESEAAADAWLLLGRVAAHRRDVHRASQALRTAAALEVKLAGERGPDEDRTPDPEPWRVLGRLLLETGDQAGAAATWADLARHVPEEAARGYGEMAKAALDARDRARAEKYLQSAVAAYAPDLDSWKRLARLQERRRSFGEARSSWEAALRAEPDDLDALTALGRLALRAGDVAAAQAYFRQLRQADPDEPGALAAGAMAFLRERRAPEALALLDGWKGEADGRLSFVRGLVLEAQRRWVEAAEAFGSVGDDDEDLRDDARQSRAWALSQAGRHAEALRELEAELAQRPADARLLTTRALVLERTGRAAEAAEGLRRAVEQRERTGDAEALADLYDALAQSLARAGRPGEALAVLREALARRPRDEGLLFALGIAEERAGDMDAAVSQMKALLALNPDHAEALNFVAYAYAEKGVKLDEAERLLNHALDLRPDNGYFLDSLGWVFFQKGDPARAVSALEQADAAAGPEPTILEHLGDAYRRAHRVSDAEKTYRRAIRSIDAGESQDGPEKAAAQRAGLERKLNELSTREARPGPPGGAR
ncbi:MAG TPA: tetratricopeptide repeat protein [Anaeromyxobacteraceae bacterium]|nr:tetratricopeptide repeat protein [Anaeromyxobacteraceae bacterium]